MMLVMVSMVMIMTDCDGDGVSDNGDDYCGNGDENGESGGGRDEYDDWTVAVTLQIKILYSHRAWHCDQ